MKKLIQMIFTFSLILFLMSASVYSATIYDLQKVNLSVEKPKAEFSILYKTSEGITGEVISNSRFYDSDYYSFDQSPTSIKVPIGTEIEFEDLSEPGAGTKIKAYDFQVYTPSESNLYYLSSLSEAPSMALDEEGKYEFYLCVMDNYQRVNGYDNWSVNGNHRWLTKKQNNSIDKFWWYFTQVNVYVYKQSESQDEPQIDPGNPEPEIEEPEIEEPEIMNHNPELHVIKPDKFYPLEITDKGIKTNTVKWTYFDEDGDDFDHGAFELYTRDKKILIDSNRNIRSEDDLHVDIKGNMGDKFTLTMYVYDSEGNKAMKGIDIEIISLEPKIQIVNKDRVYLKDDLDIEIKRLDDELVKYINIEYISYEVLDEDCNLVEKGFGELPSKIILKDKYFEDKSYLIHQKIKTANGNEKTYESRFYIVPILEPLVSLEMVNGYIGEIKDTGLAVTQKQSPLKGNLDDYIYQFTNADGYYEIYYGTKLIYKSKGFCYQIELDDRFEPGRTYKLIQYASNGEGKTGFGSTNIIIKEAEESKLTLKIVERDNNPLTPFDEIYPKEKINLKANLISQEKPVYKHSWIENANGDVVYQINELFNGLVQINDLGIYKAISMVEFKNGETLKAEVSFIVKKIQPPIINHDKVKEIYFRNELFEPNMTAKDINVSEEHPHGFNLKLKYEWIDKTFDGLFKSEELTEYKNKCKYKLVQRAFNAELENIENHEELEFYLENIKPTIKVNDYFECSCGEEIEIVAIAYDEDGMIKTFTCDLNNTICDIDKHSSKMIIRFNNMQAGTYTYKISCIDDSGDETIRNIFIKVNEVSEYPYVKLLTMEEDRLKENRYLQIEFGNEFGLENHLKINGEAIAGNTNNLDYHLVFEQEQRDKIIAGLYFKHEGNFEVTNSIDVRSNEIKRILTLNIKKDEVPQMIISSEKEIYRQPDTREAEANLDYQITTDDQIEKIEVYINGSLIDTFDDGEQIQVSFGFNVLGDKNIFTKVYETHTYLPNSNHVLYKELLELMKSNDSNAIKISILNMKPELNLNIKNNNQIRILK